MCKEEKTWYIVVSTHLSHPQEIQWGPFMSPATAEKCVVNLAGNSDVLQAYIKPQENPRHFGPAEIEEMKRAFTGSDKKEDDQ